MKTKTLIPFLALSYGLTWGLAALLFLFYDQIVAIFGEISMTNPLFILAAYSPGIAAVIIVWLNRHTMFERGTGVTEVLLPEQSSGLASETGEIERNPLSPVVG